MNFLHEINSYAADLERYISDERLPEEWFGNPDHLAIKAANARHFEDLIELFMKDNPAEVSKIYCSRVDNRRIASAFLAGHLAIGNLGEVNLIEIMEPRPEKIGHDKVGVDHMEFKPPHRLSVIAEDLAAIHGIIPAREPKSKHNTLSITFQPRGRGIREFKFTDSSLGPMVIQEYHANEANLIYERPA
jgi:hypothetical protein